VFSTYSQIITLNTPSFIVTKHNKAIIKAIKQIAELHIKRQVINALRQQNRPNINNTLNVLISKDVLIYKKDKG
jgi:small ligand-binding sensory domain FIST